jgi:hypothetical protein
MQNRTFLGNLGESASGSDARMLPEIGPEPPPTNVPL